MGYKVIWGFHDLVENRGYRTGDDFVVGPKTDAKRIQALSSFELSSRPLIVAVDKPEVEGSTEVVQEEDIQTLKNEADTLGITYSNNIGAETLIEKIKAFKEAQGE